ncbi:serine/threonine-protein kinase [Chondromyces apiculatus]|uniref:non-specific serine/threonine protein kinase n=1 Tax=Chondromyces apiculatus DSM 436 TaxID=1192034 RepID=A0A017TFG2_9BACT|nr:serine/threonine-protein kinase [Chondromyces apiculatus]EYF08023.1 serine/threonine protein kinase [Chondromyces apiculatus DSM 436]
MSHAPGEIIDGKYRIVRLLGQGGMGEVYEGENVRIRRRVAIKVLHASVSAQDESVTRFEREAQAAARIGSDHICEVLDLGALPDGARYMVMEFMDGETLGARLKRVGRLPPERLVPLVTQVLDGLGAAHAAGIVHRDLKPDNVFILQQKAGLADFVKILDFGVSKFSQAGDELNVTRAGSVVGTPYYMSPEQARGMVVDHRSDLYALGVVLYQAVTGQVPFQANTFNELLFKIVGDPAPPPQHYIPDIDPAFAALVQRAMARDVAHRYQTCAELKDALLAWAAARPALATGAPLLQAAITQRPQTQALAATPMPFAHTPGHTPAPGQLGAQGYGSSPQHPGMPYATPAPGNISSPHLTPGNVSSPFLPQPVLGLTPSPGAAPQPGASGSGWGNASTPAGAPVPQTSSTWAEASTSTTPRKPSRGLAIALAGLAGLVITGGVTSFLMLSGRTTSTPTGAAPSASATLTVPATASPLPPTTGAPSIAPVDTAAPTASALATAAPSTSAAPTATPSTSPPLPYAPPSTPSTGRLPPPSTAKPSQQPTATTPKPKPGGAADPGY